jgi:hypothetical protein
MPACSLLRIHNVPRFFAKLHVRTPSLEAQEAKDKKNAEHQDVQTNAPDSSLSSSLYDNPFDDPMEDPIMALIDTALTPFRAYNHPDLTKGWCPIWDASPIVLDASLLTQTVDDGVFESSLFRLYLTADDIIQNYSKFPILQGSTIAFEGFERPHTRYIVEWCQWIKDHKAYLKVVGVDVFGERLPFNHPYFPSFILVLPICVADVPFPFQSMSTIDFAAYSKSYKNFNGDEVTCKVCC